MDIKKEIGERLRYARDRADIKQNRAAVHVGIHNSTLNKYESGDREADHETMVKLSDLYRVNLHWLLTGEGEMELSDHHDLLKTANQMKNAASLKEQGAGSESTGGRAYFGGADKYTEEELAIGEAAFQAAIKALREQREKKKGE
ncbi:helix-turn-helix transcriptional regulator [Paenibacillus lycopersici]|uniref:Helix-turn-helix transcriptional regulator n=1 Tax=Paenibacillus lycopersici TaxID=2704462 RepID=A0A6C0G0A6_9BACL|nr:helix-turn-helix transcriptional regulator [Paenibacillus lycopersici]QHT60639.1 helix-turn-helix transcriptional regulator [Paenibacillus lycopersici]